MLAALLIVLLAAAMVAGTFFWLGRSDPAVTGAPELIRAEAGPYKVKPDDPGGLDVAGDSETAFATSAGEDTDAALDLTRCPRPPPPPEPAPSAPQAAPAKPEPKPRAQGRNAARSRAGAPADRRSSLAPMDRPPRPRRRGRMLSSRFPTVAALNKQ